MSSGSIMSLFEKKIYLCSVLKTKNAFKTIFQKISGYILSYIGIFFEMRLFNLRINFYLFIADFEARGAADRGGESLRFQVSIVRR